MPQIPRQGRRSSADRGFSLIEILVAMGVLVVLSAAAGTMLVQSLDITSGDRMRVRAANVAGQEIELVRREMQTAAAAVVLDLTTHRPVGGSTFTVVRDAVWQDADPTDAVKELDALDITVTVTWPNMGGIQPVVTSSVLTSTSDALAAAVDIEAPPTISPDPLITSAPACPGDLVPHAPLAVTVYTRTTVLGITTTLPLTVGTVTANRIASGTCAALVKTFPVVLGVALGALPAGGWTFTVTTPYASVSEAGAWPTATAVSGTTLPVSINILGTCAPGTVTATRTADGACQPATTETFRVTDGTASGSLPYGEVASPTRTAVSGTWPTATLGATAAGVTVAAK